MGRRKDFEREQRLIRTLERPHVFAHGVQALDRILDADRQVEEYEPETVAEPVGLVDRTQVDGYEGADRQRVDGIAVLDQVVAQRTRYACEQQIVDRGAERAPDGFHVVER